METTLKLIESILHLLKQLRFSMDWRNLWTFAAMVALLLQGKKAHLYELGKALPGKGNENSRVHKLRRWLSNPKIEPKIFLPLFLAVMAPFLVHFPELTLIIDRTDWKKRGEHINLFICSIAFNGRSFPVFWIPLDKKGCSSLKEQKELLEPVFKAISEHPMLSQKRINVVADREFCSPKLPEWVSGFGFGFSIRVKKNYKVYHSETFQGNIESFLKKCKKGEFIFLKGVTITEDSTFCVNLLIYWREDCDAPIALMTNGEDPQKILKDYGERTLIENLNRDIKSGGYDIENGRVTDNKRIENLLIPIAFAYIFSLIQGELDEIRNPVPELKERKISLFKKGTNIFNEIIYRKTIYLIQKFFRQFFGFVSDVVSKINIEKAKESIVAFSKEQLPFFQ